MLSTFLRVLEDWFESGFWTFKRTGVEIGHDGIKGLLKTISFDQGPWVKGDDGTAKTLFSMDFDLAGTRRVSDKITPLLLDTGVAVFHLYRRFQLPMDFGSFPPGAFKAFVKSALVASTDAASARLYGPSSADDIVASMIPAADDTWEQFSGDMPETVGPFLPGQWYTLNLSFQVSNLAAVIDFADVEVTYVTARGNVP